jgi:hypothetical protein
MRLLPLSLPATLATLLLLAPGGAALAADAPASAAAAPLAGNVEAKTALDQNVFFFGGRFQSHWFWDSFWPFGVPYEDNYFLGAGYQKFLSHTDYGVSYGVEAGVGLRIGDDGTSETSGEIWGGGVARLDGWDVFDNWHVSPSLTLGLSFVSDPIGIEAERAKTAPKPVGMLVYMAPEVAVHTLDNPNVEYFARIQHRSGGLGLIMNFDGSNAITGGVRFKF